MVGANEPMPRVSKKLATAPTRRLRGSPRSGRASSAPGPARRGRPGRPERAGPGAVSMLGPPTVRDGRDPKTWASPQDNGVRRLCRKGNFAGPRQLWLTHSGRSTCPTSRIPRRPPRFCRSGWRPRPPPGRRPAPTPAPPPNSAEAPPEGTAVNPSVPPRTPPADMPSAQPAPPLRPPLPLRGACRAGQHPLRHRPPTRRPPPPLRPLQRRPRRRPLLRAGSGDATGPTPAAAAPAPAAPAAAASAPAAPSAAAKVAVGMTVKDKTGATIGEVTDLKANSTGKQIATIEIGRRTTSPSTRPTSA